MKTQRIIRSLVCFSLAAVAGGCASPSDDPMDEIGDTDGDDTADVDPSDGDDSSDPTGSDPSGGGDDTSGDDSSGDDSGGDDSSGDDSGGGDSGGDDSGGEPDEVDTEPPTILSVSPADGETGISADAPLVITFSEPMDKAATQVAFQSSDIAPANTTMSWNDAGDELTIVPNEPFEYAEGWSGDLDSIEPLAYSFALSTAATDVEGNELEEQFDVEFFTHRRIFHVEYLLGSMTARLRGDGPLLLGTLIAGDDFEGDHYWGVTSVALYDLPEGIEVFEEATFRVEQLDAVDDPIGDLGSLHLHDVVYSDVAEAQNAPMAADLGVLSDDNAGGWRELDVAGAVADDYDAGEDMTQFALRFPQDHDTDGITEYLQFETDGGIIFQFLMP